MKWIFIAGLLVMIPLLTGILRSQPKYLVHTAFVVGALPFFLPFHFSTWRRFRGPHGRGR